MQTVSSVLVGKRPHAAPTPPRAVRAEMAESMAHGNTSPEEEESFTTSWRKVSPKQQAVPPALPGAAHPRVVLLRESGKGELRKTVLAVDRPIWISNICNGGCTASLGKLSVPLLACVHGEKGSKAQRLVAMASPQKHLCKCQRLSSPFYPVSSKVTF